MKKKILIPTLLLALLTGTYTSQALNSATSKNPSNSVSNRNEDTKYTITWLNSDGSTQLKQEEVSEGDTPNYGDTSELQPTDAIKREGYTYAFKAWSPTPIKAYCDMTYQATYTLTQKEYTVIWHDSDKATELKKLTNVKHGTVPTYEDDQHSTPTKEGFVFTGWLDENGDSPVHAITSDTTYYAQYKQDPTKQGFDLKVNCTGCTVSDGSIYYPNYSKHYDTTQSSIVLQLALDSEHHDYPYEVNATGNADYSYDSTTGQLTINNLSKSATFTAVAQNSYIHATYEYGGQTEFNTAGIRINSGNMIVDWGDGVVDKPAVDVIEHEYYEAGTYIIKVYGTDDFSFVKENYDPLTSGNSNCITSLQTYSNLTSIKDYQFAHLEKLANINLSTNLTSIGDLAFFGASITSLRIPNKCTSIGGRAFDECNNLKQVYIPKSVTTVGQMIATNTTTFYCSHEAKPNGWNDNWNINGSKAPTYWGYEFSEIDTDYDFVNYHTPENASVSLAAIEKYKGSEEEVAIPVSHTDKTGVTRPVGMIGNRAFNNCSSITKVIFPDPGDYTSPMVIDDYAFSYCASLSIIDLTKVKAVPKMGSNVFNGVALPEGASIIVSGALYGDFLSDTTWANYKQYIKPPYIPVTDNTEHLSVAASTSVIPGEQTTFTVTAKEGYELPASVTIKVNDGVKAEETFTVTTSGGSGTFNYTPSITALGIAITGAVYKVTFNANGGKFSDSSIIKTSYFDKGAAFVAPSDPSREATLETSYTFSGWGDTPATVTADATYKAQWTEAAVKYTITFIYHAINGTLVTDTTTSKDLVYGADPIVPEVPSYYHVDGDVHVYTFADSWDKPIRPVDGNETYTAQYYESFQSYTVEWLDGDGSTVLATQNEVPYGTIPTYPGPTNPTKSISGHSFTWTGEWDHPQPLTEGSLKVQIKPIFDENVYVTFDGYNCNDGSGQSHFVRVTPYDKDGYMQLQFGATADDGYCFDLDTTRTDLYDFKYDGLAPQEGFVALTVAQDQLSIQIRVNYIQRYNIDITLRTVPIV